MANFLKVHGIDDHRFLDFFSSLLFPLLISKPSKAPRIGDEIDGRVRSMSLERLQIGSLSMSSPGTTLGAISEIGREKFG
jgi:hypothetical protein